MKTRIKLIAIKTDIGKLLIDLGKMVFGSVFLGSVLRREMPYTIMAVIGFVAAIVVCAIGLILAAREDRN
jgi:predicted Na+-dependent transporter